MLALRLAALVALLLATGAAQAQKVTHYIGSLPPPEFDKPFTATLIIRRIDTEESLHAACEGVSKIACAGLTANGQTCYLYIANDDILRKYHMIYVMSLRHELGHCNGWTAQHENKRIVRVDSVTTTPALPKDTWSLPAYPPVVCITPEWKPEPCSNRNNTVTAEPIVKADKAVKILKTIPVPAPLAECLELGYVTCSFTGYCLNHCGKWIKPQP